MKKMALILGLIMFMQTAGAEIVIDKLEDPPYLNPDGTIYTPQESQYTQTQETGNTAASNVKNNINSMQLSKMERRVFGRNFLGDSGQNRLARLEQRVFGASQSGNTDNRLKRLNTATRSFRTSYPTQYNYSYNNPNDLRRFSPRYYNNQYNNPYNMYAPYRPYRRTGIREFFKVVTGGGGLTGYSPSLNSLDSYTQNMYNNNNPYYTSVPGTGQNHMDLFSNGTSGSEMYYDDGQYRKDLNSTGGSCGVKVIY